MNEDLIASAIDFLKDPNVVSSPLTKKIEFLESKGLNQQEIEEALRRVDNGVSNEQNNKHSNTTNPSTTYNSPNPLPIDYYNVNPPALPEKTWKDYFIMATATAGVTYGIYQVVTKYLIPGIIPPSQSSIDEDKAKIDEEFTKIDKILEQLAEDQEEMKKSNETKLKDIDGVIENVNDFLSKYNKDKLKFDDDLRLMKLEVERLQNSVERNLSLTKESIKEELAEITEELNSLKQLISVKLSGDTLTSRKITPVSSIPSASEILKKAKDKSTPNQSTPNPPSEVATAAPEEPKPATPSSIKSPSVGIPLWQLQQESTSKDPEETPKSDIPTWQNTQDNKDDKVNDTIKKVGVPSWQLNTSGNDS